MGKYKKYLSIFRIRFNMGMQYRTAALAGIVTQFVWGFMELLLFSAFYRENAATFPMEFPALASYIWMQQAFLALFMIWTLENDIFEMIRNGNVAYELCRPLDIYNMWFFRGLADRISRTILRSVPILVIAVLLRGSFRLGAPADITAFVWFLVTLVLAVLVVVAFCMLIYIVTFFSLSANGIRMVAVSCVEFFSGAVIPLPFLPDNVRRIVELLPFAAMQNVPLRAYGGTLAGTDLYRAVALQLFWFAFMVWIGRLLMKKALKKVVVQGG